MRSVFLQALGRRAALDQRITFLTGDLGYSVVDEFMHNFPSQFVNCGVAEQSMMSIAAGMASSGRKVFVYSITNFATFRALEQIRNDIAYQGANVCVVAVGAGTSYGTLGYSHHGLEDMAVMRVLPRMCVLSPSDSMEVEACLAEVLTAGGPHYVRLGREPARAVHAAVPDLRPGAIEVRVGHDVTILATGAIVSDCISAAEIVQLKGLSVQVVSVPRVSPLPISLILELSAGRPILTVEEHSTVGGLGSAVLEGLAWHAERRHVCVVGYPRDGLLANGSHSYLNEMAGLTPIGLASVLESRAWNR
jgi:transketolase